MTIGISLYIVSKSAIVASNNSDFDQIWLFDLNNIVWNLETQDMFGFNTAPGSGYASFGSGFSSGSSPLTWGKQSPFVNHLSGATPAPAGGFSLTGSSSAGPGFQNSLNIAH